MSNTDTAAFKEMSTEEASDYERQLILNPESTQTPDGRTLTEVRAEQRKRDREEAGEAARRETEQLRAQAAPSHDAVRVGVVDGVVVSSPVTSEAGAAVEETAQDEAAQVESAPAAVTESEVVSAATEAVTEEARAAELPARTPRARQSVQRSTDVSSLNE